MKAFLYTAVIAALFIVMMAFGARNDQVVNVNYFFAQGDFALPVLLGISFLAGFVISWLLTFGMVVKKNLTIRKLKGRVQQTKPAGKSVAVKS